MKPARRSSRLGWALALALCCSALLAACTENSAARFPHRVHLVGLACDGPNQPACLTCNTCHAVSEPDRSYKLPPPSLCQSCHASDARQVLPTLSVVPERPSGEIAINHDLHLAMPSIGGQCVSCHAGVVRPGESTLPPMTRCFTCHEHESQWQRAECGPCHQQSDLRKTSPRSFLRHDESFMRRHGDAVGLEKNLCQTCHTQSDCQSCHDLSQDLTAELRTPEHLEGSMFHRGDFMSRHAIEARASSSRCASCHAPETCDSCHVERGVSGSRVNARNPHPPGWVSNVAGARNEHGPEARRDILACASCHEQGPATNCIRCHKSGAYGGNPHPRGWRSAREPSAEMCRYCHE